MPEPAIYADYLMPGATDRFFKWITNWEMPYYADGNVEAPTGWFAAFTVDRQDLQAYFEESGENVTDYWSGRRSKNMVWFLAQINSDGIIWVHSYEGEYGERTPEQQRRRALADYNRLMRKFTEWECAAEFGEVHEHNLRTCRQILSEMNGAPFDGYADALNREAEEQMLGRPLFPNEY